MPQGAGHPGASARLSGARGGGQALTRDAGRLDVVGHLRFHLVPLFIYAAGFYILGTWLQTSGPLRDGAGAATAPEVDREALSEG